MSINSIKFVTSGSATATNGSDTITVTGQTDLRNVYSGSAVFLGTRHVVEAVSGTAPDVNGNSTIKLRNPWVDPTTTAKLTVFNTIEGLSEAIRRAREVVAGATAINDELLPLAELTTLGFIERTGTAQYSTFNATTAGKALLGASNVATQRTALGLGTAATANTTTSGTDSTAGRLVRVQDGDIRYPLRTEVLTKSQAEMLESIESKATFIADFVRNEFKVWEAPYGQESNTITQALTTTRASEGTVNTPFGIQTRAANIARIEYDPLTGEPMGLLCEEARTNLLLWSERVSNAAWGKISSGFYTVTEMGNGFSRVFFPNDINNVTTLIHQTTAVGAGNSLVFKFRVSKNYNRLRYIQADTGANIRTVFDIELGVIVVSATNITSSSVKNYGDSWDVVLVFTSQTESVRCGLIGASTSQVGYNKDYLQGDFIEYTKLQLEAGSSPSSYMPTEGSQVTRVAETSQAAFNYNTMSGCIFFDFDYAKTNQLRTIGGLFLNSNNRFEIGINVANNIVIRTVNNGVSGGNVEIPSTTLQEGRLKVALVFDGANIKLVANGVILSLVSSFTLPSGLSFRVGSGSLGTLNSTVGFASYIPRALSDAELIALTSGV